MTFVQKLKKQIRSLAWRALGDRPRGHMDTSTPRRQIIDDAVVLVSHNTRIERKQCEPQARGTLLGDYLEFGVYRGDTFVHAYNRAHSLMPWTRFWAFDSFEGLPLPQGIDKDGEFWEGQFACDEASFTRHLDAAGVDRRRIVIVPGWFNNTLTQDIKQRYGLSIAAMVYIDCDLYESTVPVLDFLTDILATGTIVMFDDWFCFRSDPNRGVQRAWTEWLDRNDTIRAQEWHLFGAYGKSFVMYRTDQPVVSNE